MSVPVIRETDAMISLSRTESRLAQEYKSWGRMDEHARLRRDSAWHMRFAYQRRDEYVEAKEREAMQFMEAAE